LPSPSPSSTPPAPLAPNLADPEWREHADLVKTKCEQIQSLFQKLALIASRDLLSELYPYLWDIKEITNMLSNIIRGFEAGKPPQKRGVPSNMRPSVSHGGIVTLLQVGRDEPRLCLAAAFSLTAHTAAFFSNDVSFVSPMAHTADGSVRVW
jgi:hypothetical protein